MYLSRGMAIRSAMRGRVGHVLASSGVVPSKWRVLDREYTPMPAVVSKTKGNKMLRHLGDPNETLQYVDYYAALAPTKFAIVKVGGSSLATELPALASSLKCLFDLGLLPTVVVGTSRQLDNVVTPQRLQGHRVCTPEVLAASRKVMQEQVLTLVAALEERGARARPITSGVFDVDYINQPTLGYNGKVSQVHQEAILSCLEDGVIPVVASMGETATGQRLHLGADLAAHALAKELQPEKIVFLRAAGGLLNSKGEVIDTVDLDTGLAAILADNEGVFDDKDKFKLSEVDSFMKEYTDDTTVAITKSVDLPKELFTHQGSGTLIRRRLKPRTFDSLDGVDMQQLASLIELSKGGKLIPNYLSLAAQKLHKVYVTNNYRAAAVLFNNDDVPEVKFVDKCGMVKNCDYAALEVVWEQMRADNPKIFWRSVAGEGMNEWFLSKSNGSVTRDGWVVFWAGFDDQELVQRCVDAACNLSPTVIRLSDPAPVKPPSRLQARFFSSFAPRRGMSSLSRSMCSDAAPSLRVGLIGARGHTGSELIKLIDVHPSLTLGVASSRALVGQKVSSLGELRPQCDFRDQLFVNLEPDQLAQHNMDVWIMALPNDVAKPFVDALPKDAKVVDLSADYRFDPTWTYGMPERHGQRALLKKASRVANPGCYATGSQFALLPIIDHASRVCAPSIFGISGYSGAGTNPSRKNDLNELKDNLMPYALSGHMHEREISAQLQRDVHFMPHVAPWFRGIALTINVPLAENHRLSKDAIFDLYQEYFAGERLVKVTRDIPEVRDVQNKHHVALGGFQLAQDRLVVCATIDNLLKGAATQCMQNVNLLLDLPEYHGINQ